MRPGSYHGGTTDSRGENVVSANGPQGPSGAADPQGMNKITAGLITLAMLAPVATAQASPYRHPPVAQTSAKKCYKRIIHRHGAIEKRRVKCPKAATSKATWSSVAAPSGAKW
jgi:hypothetical protein